MSKNIHHANTFKKSARHGLQNGLGPFKYHPPKKKPARAEPDKPQQLTDADHDED